MNLRLFLLCWLACLLECQAFTYYVDPSCAKLPSGTFEEVKKMATLGKSQLESGNPYLAAAFKIIFKVEISETSALNKVKGAFAAIGGMTETKDRKTSDVRIYCDNDNDAPAGRWELYPDLEGAGKKSKNSKKPFPQQLWWDPTNLIYRRQGSKGVQDADDVELSLAQTYKIKFPSDDEKVKEQGENPDRETITIGDSAINDQSVNDAKAAINLLQDIKENRNFPDVVFEDLEDLVSVTLFHELCHLTKVIDAPGSPDETGWEAITGIGSAEALITPDSYAFLGLTAVLIDKYGVRLDNEAEAREGKLAWIDEKKPGSKRDLVSSLSSRSVDIAKLARSATRLRNDMMVDPIVSDAIKSGRFAKLFVA